MFSLAYRLAGESVVPVKELPAANGKQFEIGEPVFLNSGLVDNMIHSTDGNFIGYCNRKIDSDTDEGDPVPVVLALSDVVMSVPFDQSAGQTKDELEDSDIGSGFHVKDGDNKLLDLDNTTNPPVVVIDYNNDEGIAYVKRSSTKSNAVVL